MDYVPDRFAWHKRPSRAVSLGDITIGGGAPIVVQSMCTTPTQDVAATVQQCIELAEAGCQLIRITAPGVKDATALKNIRSEFSAAGFTTTPIVADIHFMPKAALEAIEHVEKVRINPGNFADKKRFDIIEYTDAQYDEEVERVRERFRPLVLRAKELGRVLRIGTNHGSLSDRIMNRFGDSPAGMVESAMEFVHYAEAEGFKDLVISMKSSNPKVMVQAYRMLCKRLYEHGENYPLHLGVTEAGDGLDGRVKGAAGIGTLLEDGIGDTIRVSLTEDPVQEVPMALALANRYQPPPFTANGLDWAPNEHIDPYTYDVRRAEIIRVADNIPVGGGTQPRVLCASSHTQTISALPADAIVAAPNLYGGFAKGPVGHKSDRFQALPKPQPGQIPVVECAINSIEEAVTAPAGALILLDLPIEQPEQALRRALPLLPSNALLAIREAGTIGATRAYRLLAAVIEELFTQAEQKITGSGIRQPICIALCQNKDPLALATIAGSLLIDGIGDAVYLPAADDPVHLAFTILQAVKARITRTDYVACPSCGRTLFDLVDVTAHIREVTNHLDGVTIAIMGCIVNGPGEMADADFGFVGSGPGKVDLYRGKEKVVKNLPFAEARAGLIQLIKDEGMWKEPSATAS